jgi:Cys-rich repeat protein
MLLLFIVSFIFIGCAEPRYQTSLNKKTMVRLPHNGKVYFINPYTCQKYNIIDDEILCSTKDGYTFGDWIAPVSENEYNSYLRQEQLNIQYQQQAEMQRRQEQQDSNDAWSSIAQSLNSIGNSFNQSANQINQGTNPLKANTSNLNNSSLGCTSNASCGIGYSCVKPQFSSSGSCMKTVNAQGVQQFNTNGSGMGIQVQPECRFDSHCSAGFTCRIGHCVR